MMHTHTKRKKQERKTLVGTVQTEQELKTLLSVLAADMGRVRDYWWLFNRLLIAKQGRYTLAVTQSQTFWSLVYGGLQDAALGGLSRAYDQTNHDDVLTLRSLLETLLARPAFLPASALTIDRSKLLRDLRSVSKENSTAVAHLSKWRNKLLAHRDARKILSSQTLGVEAPLTYRDIDTLIRRAFRILNRYGVTLFNTSHPIEFLVGSSDYVEVLKALQRDAVNAQRAVRGHGGRLGRK